MSRSFCCFIIALWCCWFSTAAYAADDTPSTTKTITVKQWEEMEAAVKDGKVKGDTSWMMISTALVMLMVPGLALFYGGMVRRKNVLGTMMQSMVPLAIVGVYWVVCGYSLAFGSSRAGLIGWSSDLFCLHGIKPDAILPNTNIPVYLHVLFQGMFAIITPALISGAMAERIRFLPYCIFVLLWSVFVYTPLAHWVWAMDWFGTTPGTFGTGTEYVGWLGAKPGKGFGALDFAGGTVVHIAAGLAGLAAVIVLPARRGFPNHPIHPNSIILTLLGAGLLWFGWFGFNAGSATASGSNATSAFLATQVAAAAAALSWMLVEWLHRKKPTALGFASGLVAGLVAVTPASGFIYPSGAIIIGLLAGLVCYAAVYLKTRLKYDDSLDAFGVHGVGGFLGAVLTGVFWYKVVNDPANAAAPDGFLAGGGFSQVYSQLYAAGIAALFSFVVSFAFIKVLKKVARLHANEEIESEGLDLTQHGEIGLEISGDISEPVVRVVPRHAMVPPNGVKRFTLRLEGIDQQELTEKWSKLCQETDEAPNADFRAVYSHVTTVEGNRFRFRHGDPEKLIPHLEKLFQDRLIRTNIKAVLETKQVQAA
jgi:ammonium transporter, Amt family